MNPRIDTRWPEIEALLDDVLDQPTHLRQAWLRAHCDDAELRSLVLSLLDADSVHGNRIEAHAAAAHDWLDAHAVELPEIPGYRVLHLLGEGGMASVFLAERVLGQTVQEVALKRLRLNVYDPGERRRFEHEHRVLARLEHPHIARLIDAGIAPDGVPWFAMEYVEGEPLIAWCDARRLAPNARLALFADLCAAIQHAHQHLVVHRDLKPSNILVDKEGRGKVLDFGIARLLDPDTDRPDGTRTEARRLTPGYAAPEQYAGQASTATDVYALGVILIELLCGQRPAGAAAAGSDPLRGVAITGANAGARASTRNALERMLSGDLGAIARKAMRSEPAQRYGSVQALADDLAALRDGRPVAARRGDWRYRAACFVRRHKAAAAASVLMTATLIAATAVSLWQAQVARAQAARAQAVQTFLEDMLAPLRYGVPQDRMPGLDDVLAQGVRELERDDRRDPAVYDDLLVMFARTYERMGDHDNAHELARRAYEHGTKAFGADDPRTLRAQVLRASTQLTRDDGDETARADLKAAHARMLRLGIDGVPLAEVLDELGSLELMAKRPQQAAVLIAEALRQRENDLGPQHPEIAAGYAHLAEVQMNLGNVAAALPLHEQAYRLCTTHEGTDSRQAAIYLASVAQDKHHLGLWREGVRDFDTALAVFDRVAEPGHPERYTLLLDSCTYRFLLDELPRAQADCDAAEALAAHVWGTHSRSHAVARRYRLPVLAAQGRLREAHAEAEAIRADLLSIPGENSRVSLALLDGFFSEVQWVEGDYAGMRAALTRLFGNEGWVLGVYRPLLMGRLAVACAYAPDPACAPDLAAQADGELDEPILRQDPQRIEAQLALTRLDLKQGDIDRALSRLDDIERVAALPQARLPASHRWLLEAALWRGDALAARGDAAGARREWLAAEAGFAPRYPADHPFRRHLADRLGLPGPR